MFLCSLRRSQYKRRVFARSSNKIFIFQLPPKIYHLIRHYNIIAVWQQHKHIITMTKSLLSSPLLLIIAAIASSATAFIIHPSSTSRHQFSPSRSIITSPTTSTITSSSPHHPLSIIPTPTTTTPSIRSKSTQLHSFFGLGPAELAIIGLAAIFLIGPSKLTDFTRSAGEVAGKEAAAWKELKNIPEEFQKGLEEGEIEGRSRKAKVMEKVDEED